MPLQRQTVEQLLASLLEPPKERPPVNTGSSLLDTVLEFLTPKTRSEAMAGAVPFAGSIAPSTFRAMTPAVKSMLTMIANAFPEKFAEVLKHPRELMSFIGDLNPGILGELRRTKVGNLPIAQSIISPKAGTGLETPVHEILGHLLAEERIAKTTPRAAESFSILSDVLPPSTTGSLRNRTHQLRAQRSAEAGFNRLAGTSGPLAGAVPESILQKSIMDEAMASLAEAQSLPTVDPIVKKLAEALGLTLR